MPQPNMEPAYCVEVQYGGKGWEVWSFDHDKEVMQARYNYLARHPVPGRAVRLVGLKGEILDKVIPPK